MALPRYLALTAAEISALSSLPAHFAYMACQFSSCGEGLSNIPGTLPDGAMLIVNDQMPCCGHSPALVAAQLSETVARCHCESVLLDFQRPPEPESEAMVDRILEALPCPAAVTESFAETRLCPVFLSPPVLHLPLRDHISPWSGREIWLEAALCQEEIRVTEKGVEYAPVFPTRELSGGFWEEALNCQYQTDVSPARIRFTLFDTHQSLDRKLALAQQLGVTLAVGLWQELGTFLPGKSSS